MAIRIITDSSSDFDAQQLHDLGVGMVSMTINAGDQSYADGIDLVRSDFYDMLLSDEFQLKTSQPAPLDFISVFEDARDNEDDLIVILISGALSGTVMSAVSAKKMVGYDRIHIIDSRCASAGIQMLVGEALAMIDRGYDVVEIVSRLENIKNRIRIYLGIDTLKYLYRGGRLSRVEAGLGTLANVHPILRLQDGKLEVYCKCMGSRKTFRRLAETVHAIPKDPGFFMRFLYSYDDSNCRSLMEFFPGASESDMLEIGPTLATHAGPGVFAAVFVEAEA